MRLFAILLWNLTVGILCFSKTGLTADPVCNCEANQFACTPNSHTNCSCIPSRWRCDSDNDCDNGSDELGCGELKGPQTEVTCPSGQFRCTNARCILLSYQCDGDNDCGDWSDEENCRDRGKCPPGEYRCSDGMCINLEWKCDGENDCDDGSDEINCPAVKCNETQFRCTSGRCIPKSSICDGRNDCPDNSDEKDCVSVEESCGLGQFQCLDGTCIGQQFVCNSEVDCPDGSDESTNGTCTSGTPCKEDGFPCQHLCVSTPTGHRCACKDGYELGLDGRSCLDIDECKWDGSCSQECQNTVPGYQCFCKEGYTLLQNNRGCKASGLDPFILFANRVDIRRTTMDGSLYTSVLSNLENAIAVNYHYEKRKMFWTDIKADVIRSASFNGTKVHDVIFVGLSSPGGLAVDWIGNKIFWTDVGPSRIEVANLDGSMRRVLFWKKLEKPRAIIVNPDESTLYWTDWGSEPRIERAFTDGSGRQAIVTTALFWPNGLAIDYPIKRLFWTDAKHRVIESANLDGSDRKQIVKQGLQHPYAISVFEDYIYWTDWRTKSIHKANKFTGQKKTTVLSNLNFPMELTVVHPLRQPNATNPCGENNGRCSHLCLGNNKSYSCACPTGISLKKNGQTCKKEIDSFLLFTRRNDIRWLCLECYDQLDVPIPLQNISSAVALDWDSDTNTIYWTDVTSDTINKANWNGSDQKVVIDSNLERPAGLAVDWVSQNLYWTDSGTDRIEVSNLDGTMRTILVWEGLDRPRDIIVDPIGGYMYWTDWGINPKIERAGMDGSQRVIIVEHNLTWPNGLAIDYEKEKLYWADAGMKTIELSGLDGRNRKVLIASDLPHPFGLALFEDLVYWTDWEKFSIQSANKKTGKDRAIVLAGLENLMDIHVFHRKRQPVPHPCRSHNGGCSHLCLLAPLPDGYTCACPTGIVLQDDKRTCATDMQNFLIIARRTDIRKISLDVPYLADVVLPVNGLKNVVSLDVDKKDGKIYWSDTSLDKIQRSDLNGKGKEDIFTVGLEMVDGLAVDSIGHKIYWSDNKRNHIEVADLDGYYRKVLIWENLDSPRGLVLHYDKGFMYWTDWGNKPRIERADMDGESRVTIVSENLGWPNGLTIDRPKEQLLWADAKTALIEAVDLNGGNRHILVRDVPHPYGLTIAGSSIYWTDWETRAIHRANRDTGQNVEFVRKNLAGLMDIHAVQVDSTGISKCGVDNGGCSHLCLRNSHGYSCACPTGLSLLKDKLSCEQSPSAYLLFPNRVSIRRISLDTPDFTDVFLPITDVYNTVALDFDLKEGKIYFSDVGIDVLRRANLNGSNVETIISDDLVTADGLTVDWVAKNLYWTDTGRNVIEVSRTDGTSRKVLINLDLGEPRAIAVFPSEGFLFWSDWGKLPKIERSFLDGSGRRIIVATHLGWPNGLTIDYGAKQLYWADAQLDRIETSSLNGKNRVVLVQDIPHPFGLTQFSSYIYWTDWQSQTIERVDKLTGQHRTVVKGNIEYMMEVKAVAKERQMGTNPCAVQNGGCSHLCLYQSKNQYICDCPSYPDPRPCSTVPGEVISKTFTEDYDDEFGGIDTATANTTINCSENDSNEECQQGNFLLSDSALQSAYIAFSVVLLALIGLLVIALALWRRKRRVQEVDPTLTFSNPTYSTSSTEVEADKKWGWGKQLRYDNNEERLFGLTSDEKFNNLEVAALVSKKLGGLDVDSLAPPPPPPPQRIDSHKDFPYSKGSPSFSSRSPSPIKSPLSSKMGSPCRTTSQRSISDHPAVCYHPVETDI
ncbi:low-density lipoprotein receptor-related protein 4-like isoform X1 [Limulus polyphemus]|uniref:Low-density lipoprotein receptor-related protein 4-like isoform X1 n=1 Tax=Limulus polyphemus TaxID=6850 RepID=A0ABM1SMI5_LIMPO|nr:low-density lipoprotein receptor-related protein 4-like isoform X1 [Limulus polyphemus]